MKVLVTGGAGYIGSHAARLLDRAGHEVWVYDNLSRGHRGAALSGRLIVGDLADRKRVETALREHQIDAVMHFAAFALVGESVSDPAIYYSNNVVSTLALLDAMQIDRSCLLAVEPANKNARRSARNVEGLDVCPSHELNCFNLLNHRYVIISKACLEGWLSGASSKADKSAKKGEAA